ncbi:hypothetical protein AJ79_07570 [Helicocarpus griseus UAMH5409]|uniref:Myb-like domain-containing protein n=1 Tax=Helicocarpus griseus UAMH5409 TaxID=1447875 RepID=A0A2B7X1N8_9EURO|nr:hypothetical protein AJ79_07570 [Helicocarpus griseus UAMH5409]
MVSFSSSVINKSGKKFAPKAPIRRAGPASTAPSSARASADRQTPSQTPQPPPASITPESATPAPPAKGTSPGVTAQQPAPPPQHEPQLQEQTQTQPQAQTQTQSQPQLEKQPQTESEPPHLPPVRKPQIKSTAIPIPIPTPRRRPSIPSVQQPPAPSPVPSPSRPAATPVTVPTPTAPPSESASPLPASARPAEPHRDKHETPQATETTTESPKRPRVEEPNDNRPAKRTKISKPVTKPTSTQSPEAARAESTPQAQPSQQPQPETTPAAPARAAKRPAKPTTKRKRSAEEIAEDVVAAATERKPRARRKRQPTPEGAESIEITPTVVKMSDLCRDLRTGKKSKREMELQSMDQTELIKKQKEREERIRNGHKTPKAGSADRGLNDEERDRAEAAALGGPQMRIVNGEIVIDATSLQIDRHANAARNEGDMEEVEENPLTKRINAASFGKRTKVESWDEEMTDLFYRGLRMFGTDFMMISKMFPGRSRRQIKLKFSNEERRDPGRIKDTLLGPREQVDLETYSEMTNTVYDDPRVIEKELDEEKRRIESEHAKEKEAREQLMRNPNGAGSAAGPSDSNVLPSIENGGNSRRKKGAGAKKFGGGSEEILGTIDDIAVSA